MRRVGLACSSTLDDRHAYSGTPYALARALSANETIVVGMSAALPRRFAKQLERATALSHLRISELRENPRLGLRSGMSRNSADPVLRAARSLAVRSRLRGSTLDVLVQWGTDFDLPEAEYVTYDDQTIAQAARAYDYSWTSSLSPRERNRLIGWQRDVFSGARACCVTTQWAAESVAEDYGVEPSRVHVVGIGPQHELEPPAQRDWRTPRFLFVGLNWERKNGPLLVDAFARVVEEHPSAELHLVGAVPVVARRNVHNHGLLPLGDPAAMRTFAGLFADATCFVLPSKHEPSAQAHIEAASAGIGSIGSASGGSRTLIGGSGIVVRPDRHDDLVEAMAAFCDPATAARYGAMAGDHATQFSWAKVAGRILGAYDRPTAPTDLDEVVEHTDAEGSSE